MASCEEDAVGLSFVTSGCSWPEEVQVMWADRLREKLKEKDPNLLRTWRTHMDRNGDSRVCFKEYLRACEAIGLKEVNLVELWVSLDKDSDDSLTLNEVDPFSFEVLSAFKSFCTSRFGDPQTLFRAMDTKKSGILVYEEFKSSCERLGFSLPEDQFVYLFEGLEREVPENAARFDRGRDERERAPVQSGTPCDFMEARQRGVLESQNSSWFQTGEDTSGRE